MRTKNYTFRIRGSDGTVHESLVRQLLGDALMDARTITLLGPGGLQTIQVLRQPGSVVVLSEERVNGARA